MPVKVEGRPSFHLCFAISLTALAVAAHLGSSWFAAGRGENGLAPVILLFCWGTLPYLALAALTWVIRSVPVLLITTALLAGTDFIAVHGALVSERSTSGLALMFQPALALLVLVPAASVVGLFLRSVAAWRRRGKEHGCGHSSD